MNKFFGFFKHVKSYKKLNIDYKKKILYYNIEYEKFMIKEVNLKDYLKEGKTLLLSPYPCKIFFLIFENS